MPIRSLREVKTISAETWFSDQQSVYMNLLRDELNKAQNKKSDNRENFYENLNIYYSLRIINNPHIELQRNKTMEEILQSKTWQEIITNLNQEIPNQNLPSNSELNFNRNKFLKNEFLYNLLRKLPLRVKHGLFYLYTIKNNLKKFSGHLFITKKDDLKKASIPQLASLIDILIITGEYTQALNLIKYATNRFIDYSDKLWLNQQYLRISEFLKKDEKGKPNSQTYTICKEDWHTNSIPAKSTTYIPKSNEIIEFTFDVKTFEPEELYELNNLIIDSSGIAINSMNELMLFGAFHDESDFYIGPTGTLLIPSLNEGNFIFSRKSEETVLITENAFLLSTVSSGNYWHALIEALPRILNINNTEIAIWVGAMPNGITDLAQILKPGLDIRVFKDVNVLCNSLTSSNLAIISDEPFWNKFPTFDVNKIKMFQKAIAEQTLIHEKDERNHVRYIYIRRKKSHHRKNNASKFYAKLEKIGFVEYVPESQSLLDQWRVFSNADVIVGEVGAVWANLIFCKKGTLVFNLCTISSAPTPLFSYFAKLLELEFINISFQTKWKANSKKHWHNTKEGFYQSGFKMEKLESELAIEFISENINSR